MRPLKILAALQSTMRVIWSFTWWVHSCYAPLIMGFMITWPLACDREGHFVVSWRSAGIHCGLGCKSILRFYWRDVAHVQFRSGALFHTGYSLTSHTILHCHYYINLQCLISLLRHIIIETQWNSDQDSGPKRYQGHAVPKNESRISHADLEQLYKYSFPLLIKKYKKILAFKRLLYPLYDDI